MAGNVQYSNSFRTAVISSVTSAVAGYPATRMLDKNFPLRPWMSTSLAVQQDIVFDLGSALSIVEVEIYDANFTTLHVATGTVATPTDVSYNADDTTHTLLTDKWTNRTKLRIAKVATKQYLRLRVIVQSVLDGSPGFQIAYVGILSAVTTMTANPWTGMQIKQRQAMLSNGLSDAEAGPFYLEIPIENQVLPPAQLDEWRNITLFGHSTPFHFFFNNGNDSEIYLMKSVVEPTTSWDGPNYHPSLTLREHIGYIAKS